MPREARSRELAAIRLLDVLGLPALRIGTGSGGEGPLEEGIVADDRATLVAVGSGLGVGVGGREDEATVLAVDEAAGLEFDGAAVPGALRDGIVVGPAPGDVDDRTGLALVGPQHEQHREGGGGEGGDSAVDPQAGGNP